MIFAASLTVSPAATSACVEKQLSCGVYVRLPKSAPLNNSGSRVVCANAYAKQIAKVQTGGVISLAKSPPGLSCRLRLFRGDWLQLNPRLFNENVKLVTDGGTATTLQDDGGLQKGGDRHAARGR